MVYHFSFGVEWVIVHWIFRLFGGVGWSWAHKIMTTHSASLFWFTKSGNITVQMCPWVIKYLSDGISCEWCRFGFLFCDGVECWDYGSVYSPRIVQHYSENIFEFFSYLSSSEVVSSSGTYCILAPYQDLLCWWELICLWKVEECWNLWRYFSM